MTSFLQQYQRQAKIFIDLPSTGIFYDASIIEGGKSNGLPVFGMNTMDELLIKTPDALFSGEATAQIIKSCVPNILDPWKLVSYDVDYILIAIRMATYGDTMPVTTSCPKCNESTEHDLNLPGLLEVLSSNEIKKSFNITDLRFELRPLNYAEQTSLSKENFSLQKRLAHIEKTIPEEDADRKDKLRQEVFNDLTQLTASVAINHVHNISNGTDVEFDFHTIKQFVINNDAEIFNMIQDTVKEMNDTWSLPDFSAKCSNENCEHEFKSKISVDYSSFFGKKSLTTRNLTL